MNNPTMINIDRIESAVVGDPITADVLLPLQRAISQFLKHGTKLEAGLGLTYQRIAYRKKKQRRDYHLKCAAWIIADGDITSASIGELAEEIKTFNWCIWPRWKDLLEPPADRSRLRLHLFHAAKPGLKLPESHKHLFRIICQDQ